METQNTHFWLPIKEFPFEWPRIVPEEWYDALSEDLELFADEMLLTDWRYYDLNYAGKEKHWRFSLGLFLISVFFLIVLSYDATTAGIFAATAFIFLGLLVHHYTLKKSAANLRMTIENKKKFIRHLHNIHDGTVDYQEFSKMYRAVRLRNEYGPGITGLARRF